MSCNCISHSFFIEAYREAHRFLDPLTHRKDDCYAIIPGRTGPGDPIRWAHVHLAVFIICQIIGIILLHYVFRIITYLINRYTQLPQDILKHQFIKAIYQAYQDAEIKLLERTP